MRNESTIDRFTAGVGGGVRNLGDLTLSNSELLDNSASFNGGGILNGEIAGNATVTLISSTVSGNSANSGGGIYNYALPVGYYQGPATVTLTGSLVANSPNGGNCGGPIPVTYGGNNLADDATCGTIPDTLTGLGPLLADNGGPTMTHALLAGSNAIDLAGDCGLASYQRLAPRNDGSCDSGWFEFGALPAEIFADGSESGDTSAWSSQVP